MSKIFYFLLAGSAFTHSGISYAQLNNPDEIFLEDGQAKCSVYDPHPEPNEKVVWKGECKNGLAQGFGNALWVVNDSQIQKWTGYFDAGKPTRLKIEFLNKPQPSSYEGNFPTYSNGVVRVIEQGTTFIAAYKDGSIVGDANINFKDGSMYIGGIKDWKYHGYGYLRYANFDQYQGNFFNGKRQGFGVLRGQAAYQGNWLNDKFEGQGQLKVPDSPQGIVSIGQFHNGQLEGSNIVTIFPDGQNIVGDMHNGRASNTMLAPNNTVQMPNFIDITKPAFNLVFHPIF